MKKLFVLGIALFFCLFFVVGCNWVTPPLFIPDNGGIVKQRDGSSFDNTLVNNKRQFPFS